MMTLPSKKKKPTRVNLPGAMKCWSTAYTREPGPANAPLLEGTYNSRVYATSRLKVERLIAIRGLGEKVIGTAETINKRDVMTWARIKRQDALTQIHYVTFLLSMGKDLPNADVAAFKSLSDTGLLHTLVHYHQGAWTGAYRRVVSRWIDNFVTDLELIYGMRIE